MPDLEEEKQAQDATGTRRPPSVEKDRKGPASRAVSAGTGGAFKGAGISDIVGGMMKRRKGRSKSRS